MDLTTALFMLVTMTRVPPEAITLVRGDSNECGSEYVGCTTTYPSGAVLIEINRDAPNPLSTLAHEYAHVLDHAIGGKGHTVSFHTLDAGMHELLEIPYTPYWIYDE